jgi:uncharacterized protein YecE (DUF72 family)
MTLAGASGWCDHDRFAGKSIPAGRLMMERSLTTAACGAYGRKTIGSGVYYQSREGVVWGDTAMSLFPAFDDAYSSAPQAARLKPKLRALAEQGTYFGTSSWKYEGWLGSIYDPQRYATRGKFSKKRFEETCIAEYAQTFPTVCGDFAFYQFPTEEYWERLFGQIPEGFLLGLKVPEDITVPVWPKHSRYGKRAGLDNEHFLDARTFKRFFAIPLQPYKEQLGPLIFEFGTFNKTTFPTPGDFRARLDPFLGSLPEGFRYAVEIRNQDYLSPDYFRLLSSRNVAHVFNAWTRMPVLEQQARLSDAYTADFTVVRALLARGRTYEQAVKSFEPYDRLQELNEGAREGVVEIARQSRQRKVPSWLFINNRLEGHAPTTIEAVAKSLA